MNSDERTTRSMILFFAIGLRKGLMDFVIEWLDDRRDRARRDH